ncbi:MAG: hypothetical protein FWC43_08505 [Planctomycetaceae bacterium]|nr:hypothetical protein [Planctomycetaceae bacterium]
MIFFILLDTNVILDFAMKRGEHYAPAMKIMKKIAEGHLIADRFHEIKSKTSHRGRIPKCQTEMRITARRNLRRLGG